MSHTTYPLTGDVIARAVLTSEVISGCTLTIDGGGLTFSIASGRLRFVSTSNGRTTAKTLTYPGESGITPVFADGNNYIAINESFVVTQLAVNQDYADLEANIVIGVVITTPGLTPVFVTNEVNVSSINIPGALYDLSNTLNPIKKTGLVLTDSGNNDLEFLTTAGEALTLMRGALTTPNTPNVLIFAEATVTNYLYLYFDAAGTGINIDVEVEAQTDSYDDGSGTLASLLPNRWTVQRLYSFGDPDTIVVHYGQEQYTTLSGAILGMATESFIKFSPLDGALFWGYAILKNGATDLSDTAEVLIVNPRSIAGETNTTIQGTGVIP